MSVAIVLKSPLGGVISKYPPISPWRLASPERSFGPETFSGLQGIFRHTAKRSVCARGQWGGSHHTVHSGWNRLVRRWTGLKTAKDTGGVKQGGGLTKFKGHGSIRF